MTLGNIVAWLLFGLIIGVVANMLDPRPNRMGLLGSMVLGIIGAVLGGLVAGLFGFAGVTGFNLYSFIIALLGSLVVLWIGHSLYSPTGYGAEYYDEDLDVAGRDQVVEKETRTRRVERDER